MINKDFDSLYDLLQSFPDEQSCIDHLTSLRWNDEIVSPFDEKSKVYVCKGNKYRCKNTKKYFNVKTGTLLDDTRIPLQKWFLAVWLITSHKKGISSVQLSKDIGVTQKTAWFLLQRIRNCFGEEDGDQLEGTVEADETFVGGKNKNRHADKKVKNSQGRSFKDKTPVLGLLERAELEIIERPHKIIQGKTVKEKVVIKESKIIAITVSNTKKGTIQPLINANVKYDSRFMSDEWSAYRGLSKNYDHFIVDHSKKEYVNAEDNSIHSNSIEGAWSILKRMIIGIYHKTTRKHLQLYVDEFVFRYNTKKCGEAERFNLLNYILSSSVLHFYS